MTENQQRRSTDGGHFDEIDLVNEINLVIFVRRVFFRWRWHIFVSIVVLIAGFFIMLANATTVRGHLQQEIRLLGVHDGKYPNGTNFRTDDLLTPEVQQRLADLVNMPELPSGLLSVDKTGANSGLLRQIYQKRGENLPKGDLRAAELENLHEEMLERIKTDNANMLILRVHHEKFLLPKETAEIIMSNWPGVWEDEFVNNFRVMTDLTLQLASFLDPSDLKSSENVFFADSDLNHITEYLTVMSKDSRLNKMLSPQGRTPAEMLRHIEQYRAVFFDPLYAGVMSVNSPMSEFYMKNIKLDIEAIDKQLASLEEIVQDILTFGMGAGIDSAAPEGAPQTNTDQAVQFSSGALDEIVSLVQQATFRDLLTETMERRYQLSIEKSEMLKRLAHVEDAQALTDEFIKRASVINTEIINEYNAFLKMARKRVAESRLDFYDIESVVNYLRPPLINRAFLQILGFVAVMASIMSVFVTALIPMRDGRDKAHV